MPVRPNQQHGDSLCVIMNPQLRISRLVVNAPCTGLGARAGARTAHITELECDVSGLLRLEVAITRRQVAITRAQ